MTEQIFELTGPINLAARIGHGALVVRALPDVTTARVELTGPDEAVDQITVRLAGPTLQVSAPRQGGLADMVGALRPGGTSTAPVTATITVPAGTALELRTVTASITVEGRSAGIDLATAAGVVSLGEVDGDLRLRFGTTDADVRLVSGSVSVQSATGSARFGDIGGDLSAGCARGSLTVGRVAGAVRYRSGSGDARFAAVHGDVDLAAGAGSLEIGLPAGVTAALDVTTGAGRLHSDLPVRDEPASRERTITVRARTGRGDIHLFRAA